MLKDVNDIRNLDFIMTPEENFTEHIGQYVSYSQPKRTLITVQYNRIESFRSKLLKMNLNLGAYMFSYDINNKGEVFETINEINSTMLTFLFIFLDF